MTKHIQGIGSNVRKAILDPEDNKIQSLLSAYLVRIPLEAVQADPELQPYLDQATWWIGPGAMCIATRLHHVGLFEVHFYVDKELGEPGVWDASGDIDDIRRDFAGWDPILLRMLGHAPSRRCWLWRVSGGAPLPTWISKGGRIVITGDASHAMVPYASQGASQGIEDAAVLAECVSREGADLTAVLKVFEKIRKGRAEAAVVCGATRKAIMHVPDGPAQEARDEQLRAGGSKGADSSGASWDPDAHDALPERGCSLMELDDYLMGHDALRYVSASHNLSNWRFINNGFFTGKKGSGSGAAARRSGQCCYEGTVRSQCLVRYHFVLSLKIAELHLEERKVRKCPSTCDTVLQPGTQLQTHLPKVGLWTFQCLLA